jgi:hypothetical protein
MTAIILALAMIALGACGDDDGDGQGDVSVTELKNSLPAADDLGLVQQGEFEWDNATDLLDRALVLPAATDASELGTAVEDAGFQAAVSRALEDPDRNVRIVAAQFDSDQGALDVRDLLHEEDLKQPCAEFCAVSPIEYELDIPDSAAVHHVPTRVKPPGGEHKGHVEAHHAEFVIGPRLYVVQVDGPPSHTFSADFDKLMQTVYESASSAE